MKRTLASLVIGLSLWMGATTSVSAQNFDKGGTAFRSGDLKAALREWRPLAEQGHASAQLNLGVAYELGAGVVQDYVKAHMWSNIAAANGEANGSQLRGKVAKMMTAADISKAQQLARECVAKNYKGC